MKQMPVLSGLSCTASPADARQRAHLGLGQVAERKQARGERVALDRMQEVRLVLGRVPRLVQLGARGRVEAPRIVAGGETRARRGAGRGRGRCRT